MGWAWISSESNYYDILAFFGLWRLPATRAR
jgi:hypothetical protein